MAGQNEVDAFELPKVRDVCDQARKEFEGFFKAIPGSKDLVIQNKELMSLLEHVTPMKVLRRYLYILFYTMCFHSLCTA